MIKKVGILTWHYYPNFGSALQAFALQNTILKMGHDCVIINYHNPVFGLPNKKESIRFLFSMIHRRCKWLIPKRYSFSSLYFRKKYLTESAPIWTEDDVYRTTSGFDVVVCGSDQIWAPNVYNPVYMAAYCPKTIRKVSYAASIGLSYIPDNLIGDYSKYLSEFKFISVREQLGKKLLEDVCGLSSEVVLDPTLLVDSAVYSEMATNYYVPPKPYVFCYFLRENHAYKKQVIDYANKNHYQIIGSSANPYDSEWMNLLKDIGADEFLGLVKNASVIFTDSYHGTIFSLLFHKDFRTFMRFDPADEKNQNSRINQLDSYFDIKPHIITPLGSIGNIEFDYENFERRLTVLRKYSMDFLNKCLSD